MNTSVSIAALSFEFAIQIVKLYGTLVANKEFVLSKQLLRSGTSIGANVAEAGAAQSKRDFATKMAIASKEARETKYWLLLLEKSKLVDVDLTNQLKEVESIIRVLSKIVKTTQNNLKTPDIPSNT